MISRLSGELPLIRATASLIALSLLLAGSASAQPAEAEPPAEESSQEERDARARDHFTAGRNYYDAGDFEDALREFLTAYELSGRAELLYNISLSHERLGNFGQAADYQRRFIADGGAAVEDREEAEQRLRSLEERHQRQLDQQQQTTPPPEGGFPLGAAVLFAGAGAAGITTITLGVLALRERDDIDNDACAGTMTCDVDRMDRLALAADIFLGVTIAAAGAGLLVWLLGRDSGADDAPPTPETRLRLSPWAAPSAGGASLSGSF
jgi:tetratricopeptide (TPR) repeat protein